MTTHKAFPLYLSSCFLTVAVVTAAPAQGADGASGGEPPRLTQDQLASVDVAFDPSAVEKYVMVRPQVAVGGKDVVALHSDEGLVDGVPSNASYFDRQTYYFSSPENKNKFDSNPQAYIPVLSGCDPVTYKETGMLVQGVPDQFILENSRLFFFTNAKQKAKFEADPAAYENVDLVLEGFSPVSLVDQEVLRRGESQFGVIFEGHRVLLASFDEKEAFLDNLGRFYPTFGGLDVVSLVEGKPRFGVPKYSAIYKNRLYSFASPQDRDRFVASAEPHSNLDVAMGGNDPVAEVEDHAVKKGHYGISTIYRGKRYLFANEMNRVLFIKNPSQYVKIGVPPSPSNSTDVQEVPQPPPATKSDEDPFVKEPVLEPLPTK